MLKVGLVKQARELQREAANQQELKEKYRIDEDVLIVEKTNTLKFLLRYGTDFLQLVFRIILIGLAFIGLCSLVYPAPRQAMFQLFSDTFNQLSNFF